MLFFVLAYFAWGSSWKVRFARMEGAATDIKEAAADLKKISTEIHRSKRIHRIAELSNTAKKLQKQIHAANLALERMTKE